MAQYNPDQVTYYATVSWQNSGEAGVSTKVYFGGPFGSPPASGTLPLKGTASPARSSLEVNLGSNPQNGTYYAQVRHTKAGFPDSDLAPVAPVGALGPF